MMILMSAIASLQQTLKQKPSSLVQLNCSMQTPWKNLTKIVIVMNSNE